MNNNRFQFNEQKALAALAFLIDKLGKKTDFHKLFKVLYFAERSHLVKYGRPIVGDIYIAMKKGPVPSIIYDYFKYLRTGYTPKANKFYDSFSSLFTLEDDCFAILKKTYNLEYLSQSDIESLESSVLENGHLSFDELTEKSHDHAWLEADRNDDISIIDIAVAGGAKEQMIGYIITNMENQQLFQKNY